MALALRGREALVTAGRTPGSAEDRDHWHLPRLRRRHQGRGPSILLPQSAALARPRRGPNERTSVSNRIVRHIDQRCASGHARSMNAWALCSPPERAP